MVEIIDLGLALPENLRHDEVVVKTHRPHTPFRLGRRFGHHHRKLMFGVAAVHRVVDLLYKTPSPSMGILIHIPGVVETSGRKSELLLPRIRSRQRFLLLPNRQ